MHKALVLSTKKHGATGSKPGAREMRARGATAHGPSWLQSKFEASVRFMRLCPQGKGRGLKSSNKGLENQFRVKPMLGNIM